MRLQELLRQHQRLALLIGNGINRYHASASQNSWDALLTQLARKHLKNFPGTLPSGISLTEFYDILDLRLNARRHKNRTAAIDRNLQQQFCDLMAAWRPLDQHRYIMQWAQQNKSPVLTTNFEHSLSNALETKFFITTSAATSENRFTDFYPWEAYFSDQMLEHPTSGFGIWHINGMQKYHRSIRLGLTHYMGSVERARMRLHKGAKRLSAGGEWQHWEGAHTWLQILFHQPLLIFGLGLAENEVFLRWLLIERAKYYTDFPKRFQPAWYVHTPHEHDHGKLYFLQAVGVQAFEVEDYDGLYGSAVWQIA